MKKKGITKLVDNVVKLTGSVEVSSRPWINSQGTLKTKGIDMSMNYGSRASVGTKLMEALTVLLKDIEDKVGSKIKGLSYYKVAFYWFRFGSYGFGCDGYIWKTDAEEDWSRNKDFKSLEELYAKMGIKEEE